MALVPIVIGTFVGTFFGSQVVEKVRERFSSTPKAKTVQLDPKISPAMRSDVENLLQNIRDPHILRTAADYYRKKELPQTANALDARARYFMKEATP